MHGSTELAEVTDAHGWGSASQDLWMLVWVVGPQYENH